MSYDFKMSRKGENTQKNQNNSPQKFFGFSNINATNSQKPPFLGIYYFFRASNQAPKGKLKIPQVTLSKKVHQKFAFDSKQKSPSSNIQLTQGPRPLNDMTSSAHGEGKCGMVKVKAGLLKYDFTKTKPNKGEDVVIKRIYLNKNL